MAESISTRLLELKVVGSAPVRRRFHIVRVPESVTLYVQSKFKSFSFTRAALKET